MEHPSGGDCRTVHKALRDYERDRFLLCIATLQPESSSGGDRGYGGRGYSNSRYNTRNARNVNYKANLRAFIFSRSSAKYTEGKIDTSPSDSPFANKFTPQLPPSSSSANSGSSSGSSSSSSSTGDGAQWYMDKNTEFGTALFTKLNSYLKMESQNGKVGISRSTTTQDISLSFAYPTLEYKCTLSFLCDFPSSKAHLHIAAADPQASSDTADVEVAFSTDGDNALSFVDKILKKAKIMAQTIDLSASVSASAPSSLSSLSSSSYALPGNGAGGGHRNYRNNRNTRGNNNGGNNFATNNNSTTNSALNSTPSNFRRVISSDNPLGAGHPSSSSLSSSASASSSSSSSSPSASPSAAPFQPKLGDFVDARDMKGYWYRAKVIFVDNGKYKCHFPEFASKWDEWKSLADMAAMGTHTGEIYK